MVILIQTIETADREQEVSFYYKVVGIIRHVYFTTFMKKMRKTEKNMPQTKWHDHKNYQTNLNKLMFTDRNRLSSRHNPMALFQLQYFTHQKLRCRESVAVFIPQHYWPWSALHSTPNFRQQKQSLSGTGTLRQFTGFLSLLDNGNVNRTSV